MKPYKFSTVCKKSSCTKKSKYYFPSDIDNEGNMIGLCEQCLKEIHQLHELKLVCAKNGNVIMKE